MNKKVFLKTFGCQMNESDSEIVRSILTRVGYRFVDVFNKADIILFNTCSVRETATRKVFGQIYEIRHQLAGKPVLIGILGCMATDAKQELLKNKKLGINFIAGPDSYKRLPELITQAKERSRPCDIDLSLKENYTDIYPARTSGVNAWVTIMRGCDNFCSYCIVPYVRGRERSRLPKGILAEVKRLVREGYPQVTFLGQNVNSYNVDNYDFPKLLDEIAKIKGIKRIRFMSPHPKDFSKKLIDVIAKRPNVCKHIHLPLQSGSSRILKLMNRKYTKAQYLTLVKKIRTKCPAIAITTDVIVGFPTESEKDFRETLDVVKKARFDSAFIFKYSPRSGTAAQRHHPDAVTPEIKTKRIMLLHDKQIAISLEKNKELVGRTEKILIEEKQAPNLFRGRTDTNKLVSFSAQSGRIGQIVDIYITHASVNGLSGEVAGPALKQARR